VSYPEAADAGTLRKEKAKHSKRALKVE
jgi:hypothetical protein